MHTASKNKKIITDNKTQVVEAGVIDKKISLDWDVLDAMIQFRPSKEFLADYFGVSHDTIERRIKEKHGLTYNQYKNKKSEFLKLSLRQKVIEQALGGNPYMLQYACEKLRVFEDQSEDAIEYRVKSFTEFCEVSGYPAPFEKQIEMMDFMINGDKPRLLLGSRGYGKTDYGPILGLAYKIYCDKDFTALIVTKSDERNASILNEISKALEANGIHREKENTECIRVVGLHGKDNSVSAITVGSKSVRGRHPKLILMDDPVTEDDTSDATRRKVKKLYNELNKLCANICIIGQPVHKADLYQELRGILKKMEVPYGTIPELDHDIEAQRLSGVSEESIQASYFLNVVSENPSPFEGVNYIDAMPQTNSVAFIDPSFEGGDYTALSVLTGHFQNVAVQGHVYKKAWNHCLDDMCQRMIELKVKKVCFEVNSLGDQPLIMLRNILSQHGISVVGKKSNHNKHARIMNAGVFAKNIFLSKKSDKLYVEQVTQYEYKAKYDDAPDSLASLLEWVGLVRGR